MYDYGRTLTSSGGFHKDDCTNESVNSTHAQLEYIYSTLTHTHTHALIKFWT